MHWNESLFDDWECYPRYFSACVNYWYSKVLWRAPLGFLPPSGNCQACKWGIFAVLASWLNAVALPLGSLNSNAILTFKSWSIETMNGSLDDLRFKKSENRSTNLTDFILMWKFDHHSLTSLLRFVYHRVTSLWTISCWPAPEKVPEPSALLATATLLTSSGLSSSEEFVSCPSDSLLSDVTIRY